MLALSKAVSYSIRFCSSLLESVSVKYPFFKSFNLFNIFGTLCIDSGSELPESSSGNKGGNSSLIISPVSNFPNSSGSGVVIPKAASN